MAYFMGLINFIRRNQNLPLIDFQARKTTNEYKCELCGGIFEDEWTEEDRVEEYNENFIPEEHGTAEEGHRVCDDCYNEGMEKWGMRNEK